MTIKMATRISKDEKTQVAYLIMGVNADLAQMGRAYLRYEYSGCIKNIDQILSKLTAARKIMAQNDKAKHKGRKKA